MEPDPAKVGESGAPEKPDKQSDPWGIKRAENLIGSLQGVLSARVVATGSGEIKEIHVFTRGGTAAKQVVRNVESALLAHLGLAVDHRKISVAQTDEVSPMEVLEEEAVRLRASRRQLVFQKLEVTTLERQRVRFGVRLVLGDVDVVNALVAEIARVTTLSSGLGGWLSWAYMFLNFLENEGYEISRREKTD